MGGALRASTGLRPGLGLSNPTPYPTNRNTFLVGAFWATGKDFSRRNRNSAIPAGGQPILVSSPTWAIRGKLSRTSPCLTACATTGTPAEATATWRRPPARRPHSSPAAGNLFDQFGAGLGSQVKNPNNKFGPQVGFAWDPQEWQDGRSVAAWALLRELHLQQHSV